MNKKLWNNVFLSGRKYPPINSVLLNKIFSKLKNDSSALSFQNVEILDLGCGTGDMLIKLAKLGAMKLTGVDISNEALKIAKEEAAKSNLEDKIKFVEEDLENLENNSSLSSKEFYLIFCKLVYPFINKKTKLLTDIKNMLADKGFFVLITPVLYKDQESNDRTKKISTDFYETKENLEKIFSSVEILNESFFGEDGVEITFLCKK